MDTSVGQEKNKHDRPPIIDPRRRRENRWEKPVRGALCPSSESSPLVQPAGEIYNGGVSQSRCMNSGRLRTYACSPLRNTPLQFSGSYSSFFFSGAPVKGGSWLFSCSAPFPIAPVTNQQDSRVDLLPFA